DTYKMFALLRSTIHSIPSPPQTLSHVVASRFVPLSCNPVKIRLGTVGEFPWRYICEIAKPLLISAHEVPLLADLKIPPSFTEKMVVELPGKNSSACISACT